LALAACVLSIKLSVVTVLVKYCYRVKSS